MHIAVVVTGAPLAARTSDLVSVLDAAGHQVTVCPTAAAHSWARVDDRWLPSGRVRPDALVVAPATFNTLNKWAAGLNDTPALNILNDALGLGTRTLAIPMVADRLAAHPAWTKTLDVLVGAGVQLLDPTTGGLTPRPCPINSGTGDQVAADFKLSWIEGWLADPR